MYEKILVPLDGSGTAERGLREAMHLAQALKSQLVLLHVVADYPLMVEMATAVNFEESRRELLDYGKEMLERAHAACTEARIPSETVLREIKTTNVADTVVEETAKQNCQLVVMGTHGRRGFNRLTMGSDAELVLRQSPVPVLLVREPEA
ncbi:universal stress protein [Ideonella sp.]|uniref:universal stress protein n=1 Tax=Ideonella sp. TaxID=1929293 RepID=UPI002B47B8D8|nr:universal stress protein [Ideonella sp.]HJV71484.1 universal stress protein [Ideonella sp.]